MTAAGIVSTGMRRRLVRALAAARAAADLPEPPDGGVRRLAQAGRRVSRQLTDERRQHDPRQFAHLNNPEAVAALHAWQGRPLPSGDDEDA